MSSIPSTNPPKADTAPPLPVVAPTGPAGAFTVKLLIYNGAPFNDHWAYWVPSHANPDIGVVLHATGNVRNGFKLQVKRSHNFNLTLDQPTKRIPLQWVDAKYFDEKKMLNNGKHKLDDVAVCDFERSAHKVEAPGKSLNTVGDKVGFRLDVLSYTCLRGRYCVARILWYTVTGICQLINF
jgi:hypothetical protein